MMRRLFHDRGAAATIEFALLVPILMYLGGAGIEYSYYGLAQLKISQIALELADNASRVGLSSTLSSVQLRETDVNDILTGARMQGAGINLTPNGRIIISSLENVQQSYDTAPVQRIHWQRCLGMKSGSGYDSSYGTTSTTAGTDATQTNAGTTAASGMGDAGYMVSAPSGYGVMFVEVNYAYQALFGTLYISATRIHYLASYVVRDRRDYSQIYNPTPVVTRSTCNLYTN